MRKGIWGADFASWIRAERLFQVCLTVAEVI